MAKTWDSLSVKYRLRLERSGYTERDYIEGKSRIAARGHAKTPERPSRAISNPDKYKDYLQRKDRDVVTRQARKALANKIARALLIAQLEAEERDQIGPRWISPEHILENVYAMPIVTFLYAQTLTIEQWRKNASIQPPLRWDGPGSDQWYASDAIQSVHLSARDINNPFYYH